MVESIHESRRRLFPVLAVFAAMRFAIAQDVPVICYHDISPNASNLMTTTPKNFADQLKLLKHEGYTTLSMDELVEFMQGKRQIPNRSIVITFDDGYEGVYKYAYPELKKNGFKATVFLVVGVVGDATRDIPHLTWPQVTEMDCSGVVESEVHCGYLHTFLGKYWSHPEDGAPTQQQIVDDLYWAKQTLAAKLGREVKYLAWPQGSYNDELVSVATQEGYKGLVTADYGLNSAGDDILRITRIEMSSKGDTVGVFLHKLVAAYAHCSRPPAPPAAAVGVSPPTRR